MKRAVFIAIALIITFIISALTHEVLPNEHSAISVILGFGACVVYYELKKRNIINDE